MKQFTAIAKGVKISTRKVRLVADAIRNTSVVKALGMLTVMDKRGAYPLAKTLSSAVANALGSGDLKREDLLIAAIEVNEGPFLKRFHASTRGRAHPYKKRSSHIKIVLEQKGDRNGAKN